MLVTSIVNVRVADCPALSLSVVGVTVNHGCDGAAAFHVSVSSPVFCRLMVWAAGLLPTVVVYVREVALSVILGEEMVMVMATVDGLPATA